MAEPVPVVAVPYSRISPLQAEFFVLAQRDYTPEQREMAIEHPHLFWVNPPQKSLSHKLRLAVWEASDRRCAYCGSDLEWSSFTVDHIHPRALGGAEDFDNLTTACRPCNSRKGARVLGGA